MLHAGSKQRRYKVQKLAPTGVAANNINGQAIHRFFGIINSANAMNPVPIDDYLKKDDNQLAFLIDELGMISKELLPDMSRYLSLAKQNNSPFGGLLTIFFGDFGQLVPITLERHGLPFHCESIIRGATYYALLQSQRLERNQDKLNMFLNLVCRGICNKFDKDVIRERTGAFQDLDPSIMRLLLRTQRWIDSKIVK